MKLGRQIVQIHVLAAQFLPQPLRPAEGSFEPANHISSELFEDGLWHLVVKQSGVERLSRGIKRRTLPPVCENDESQVAGFVFPVQGRVLADVVAASDVMPDASWA